MTTEDNRGPRLWIWWIVLAVMVAVLAVVVRRRPVDLPREAPPLGARIELASGPVTVERGGAPQPGITGLALTESSRVATSVGARALLRLPDGSRAFLRDDTAVTLAGSDMTLERGELWLEAPSGGRAPAEHRLGQASVTAEAAGLSLRRQGDEVVAYVARGFATVSSPGGRVEVRAGSQARVVGTGAPEVSAVAFWNDWTGGMADRPDGPSDSGAGAGMLYGIDASGARNGRPPVPLEIAAQSVRAAVAGAVSETTVDQTFFNPSDRDVEGWYWFTLPDGASVTGFALETDGELVEGELIERREAAKSYAAAKSSGHEPAILEWIDERTYRARITPIRAGGTRRAVLRYLELRPLVDGKIRYEYPMGGGGPVTIGEFSLTVDLGEQGPGYELSTLADARVEERGRLVTMRRSGFVARAPFLLEATPRQAAAPLRISRYATSDESADYLMVRYLPDVDWSQVPAVQGAVVVVVDTSAGGDDADRQLRVATAEAILRSLASDDRFALVSLDESARVLHPAEGLAPATDDEIGRALERLAEQPSAGATDLLGFLDAALSRVHGAEQPAIVYVGDGVATSGLIDPLRLRERLRRSFATTRARLFTVGVGHGADARLLGSLARTGGGQPFSVDQPAVTTQRALELVAAIKEPTLTDFALDVGAALDEPYSSVTGKVSRGQEVVLLARTHHELPSTLTVRGRVGGQAFERKLAARADDSVLGRFVPRLWAAERVRRLLAEDAPEEAARGSVVALGLEYGLMTPYTSFLALESERAYDEMGIERRESPLRGVRLTELLPPPGALPRGATPFGAGPRAMFGCGSELGGASSEDDDDEARPTSVAAPSAAGKPASGPRDASRGADGDLKAKKSDDGGGKEYGLAGVLAADGSPDPLAPPVADAPPMASPAPAPPRVARREAEKAPAGAELADELRPTTPRDGAKGGAVTGSLGLAGVGEGGGGMAPGGAGGFVGLGSLGAGSPADRTRNQLRLSSGELVAIEELGEVARRRRPPPPPPPTRCSDLSRRSVSDRLPVWRLRLRTALTGAELLERYAAASEGCELEHWAAERAFLELLQRRLATEQDVADVLMAFWHRPEVQQFLAQRILRRAVSPELVAVVEAIVFGGGLDWARLDRELTAVDDPSERLELLRERLVGVSDSPTALLRLLEALVDAGRADEALSVGRRLRERGAMTPLLARELGDALADAGQRDEAIRTYSEIVEFAPERTDARRLLGDAYLAQGWYEPAYRQYETLTLQVPDDPASWLRLAAAAAGAGRVDEALRLERRVARAEGRPGPDDPRRFARLASATRLARLLAVEPAGPRRVEMLRSLKELQLFSAPGSLVVLATEELERSLRLAALRGEGKEEREVALGEVTDAALVGLYAIAAPTAELADTRWSVRLRSARSRRDIEAELLRMDYDGADVRVTSLPVRLVAGEVEQRVGEPAGRAAPPGPGAPRPPPTDPEGP